MVVPTPPAAEVRSYEQKADLYIKALCACQPDRRTGSAGNRAATEFFARTARDWGYAVDTAPFPCLDHIAGDVSLRGVERSFPVRIGPYSPPCELTAPLGAVSTVEELEACSCRGKILLLTGEICAEPLMPKNFPFYNPEHHRKIYALLEAKAPAAVISAPGRNPALIGAVYPYPLIEDGDFDIPSVYCDQNTGAELAAADGETFNLKIEARRLQAEACNVILSRNPGAREKVLLCAHIDTREGTPGASDNASGTAVLLLLAEMLRDYRGPLGIEIIAFNGEDNYSAAGQKNYLARHGESLSQVRLAINLDDVGYREGKTAFSFYGASEELRRRALEVFAGFAGLAEGPPWFQGDHMIFAQMGKPALAFTAEKMPELMATVTHTPADTPELIDRSRLAELARALNALIRAF